MYQLEVILFSRSIANSVASSTLMVGVSEWGLKTCEKVQEEYNQHSWEPLKRHFKNPNKA